MEDGRAQPLPADHDGYRDHADQKRRLAAGAVQGQQPEEGAGRRRQVVEAACLGLAVNQDVQLSHDDQHADAGQHAVHDGGGDGPEPLPEPQRAGQALPRAGQQQDRPQRADAVILDDREDHDHQPGRRAPARHTR